MIAFVKRCSKGGIITYSTCTIFDEENFQVIHKFLETHPNFEQVKLSHTQEDIVRDGCITITPEQYQTDGFFYRTSQTYLVISRRKLTQSEEKL